MAETARRRAEPTSGSRPVAASRPVVSGRPGVAQRTAHPAAATSTATTTATTAATAKRGPGSITRPGQRQPIPAGQNPGRTIAVLAPFIGGFYFGKVLYGAARAAAADGHSLLAVQTSPAGLDRHEEFGPVRQYFQQHVTQLGALRLTARGMSGLVVIGNAVHAKDLERLHRTGRPLVMVSGEEAHLNMPVALPDNFGGIRAAVEHLVSHGHRRIGFVGNLGQRDMVERHEAYRRALLEHGVTPQPHWSIEVPDTLETGGRHAAQRLLEAGLPTTALIVATDRNAVGVVDALTEAGLSLPDQQAIIGFDNTEAGARCTPRLSSIEPHFDRVGELAVRMLLDPRRVGNGRFRSTTSLVVRDSCGCRPPLAGGRAGVSTPAASEVVYLRRQGQLEASISAQVEIGTELMRPGRKDPRRLEWLAASRVSAGCLALWDDKDNGPDRKMIITGVHDRTGSLNKLLGSQIQIAEFPPDALKQRCRPAGNEAVIVIPVATERREWGLLALVGSLEHRATSVRDDYNHWATLLGAALEQDELLRSEQAQRADLERSYRRERALVDSVRASEERYALIARATNDGVWDWDVSAGTVYYSPRWKSLLGYSGSQIGDNPGEWLDRVHPDHRRELAAAIAAQLGGTSSPLEVKHRIRTHSGDYRWVLCRALTVVDEAGCPSRLVGVLIDLAEQKAMEERLRQGALHDAGTGLLNPALFLDRLGTALTRARRSKCYDFAMMAVRVESGPAGAQNPEDLLRGLGETLGAGLAELDSVGRLGQTELAVLLDDVAERDVPALAEQLQSQLVARLAASGNEKARVSCGLATDCGRFATVEEVRQEADIAVHRVQAMRNRP